jgi:RNA-directed DNA polymerase
MADSTDTLIQTRGVSGGRTVVQRSFNNDLLERIVSLDNLQAAFKRVKSNKGAPGADGVTVQAFHEWVKDQWPTIIQSLRDGTYRPSPVLRCEIDKDDGSKRKLGIPTVLDRTVQQAIARIINPGFDQDFSE